VLRLNGDCHVRVPIFNICSTPGDDTLVGGYGGLLFPADDGGIEGECSTPGATLGIVVSKASRPP